MTYHALVQVFLIFLSLLNIYLYLRKERIRWAAVFERLYTHRQVIAISMGRDSQSSLRSEHVARTRSEA